MRITILTLTLIMVLSMVLSVDARAASLDQLFNAQTVLRIAPVTYNGLDVYGDSGGPRSDAGRICAMLGYSRLNSYSGSEVAISAGTSYYIAISGGFGSSAPSLLLNTVDQDRPWIFKFSAIECAR